MKISSQANVLALAAIALWASVATLGVKLSHLPPFLLTGVALLVGSVLALPLAWRQGRLDLSVWKMSWQALALGIYGLFGFHFLLFMALRLAPPVQANLVNYLWPLGIVVMAPLFLPGVKLQAVHVIAAGVGFFGAAVAILGGQSKATVATTESAYLGYLLATGSAFIWASYSLLSKRMAQQGQGFATAAIGLFALVSGLLSLACHAMFEPRISLSTQDVVLLVIMGLGPLGAAFYLWDAALKKGDARHIGIMSYITPLASTALLMLVTGQAFTLSIVVATVLIVGAAVLGTRAN
jgi:drug/metabolite transporter (DMT)-like permease